MVKVLDDFRIRYEKETGHAVCAEQIAESLIPKWEYVCWLEGLLYQAAALLQEVYDTAVELPAYHENEDKWCALMDRVREFVAAQQHP